MYAPCDVAQLPSRSIIYLVVLNNKTMHLQFEIELQVHSIFRKPFAGQVVQNCSRIFIVYIFEESKRKEKS